MTTEQAELAKEELKSLLTKLDHNCRLLFKRMYWPYAKNGSLENVHALKLIDIVPNMPDKLLPHAIMQASRAFEKRESRYRPTEGNCCPYCEEADLELEPLVNCSCHLNAPCGACLDIRCVCPSCGWLEERFNNEPPRGLHSFVPTKEKVRVLKPLTKDEPLIIDSIESHSSASQKVIGRVMPHVTLAELIKHCQGTFGGRLESRQGEHFTYIAYTD